jgi:hypothetical protein
MTLWWLAFHGGSAVIVEGNSITHARVLAGANELGRASQSLTLLRNPAFALPIPRIHCPESLTRRWLQGNGVARSCGPWGLRLTGPGTSYVFRRCYVDAGPPGRCVSQLSNMHRLPEAARNGLPRR